MQMGTDELRLPDAVRARLDAAVRKIVEAADTRLVILFGSYAAGRPRDGSDLDLLVVAETDSWHRLSTRLKKELRPLLRPLRLDLLVYTPGSWEKDRRVRGFVAREADLKGVRLYEAP